MSIGLAREEDEEQHVSMPLRSEGTAAPATGAEATSASATVREASPATAATAAAPANNNSNLNSSNGQEAATPATIAATAVTTPTATTTTTATAAAATRATAAQLLFRRAREFPNLSKASLACPCRKRGAVPLPQSEDGSDNYLAAEQSPHGGRNNNSTDFFFMPPTTSVSPTTSMSSSFTSSSSSSSSSYASSAASSSYVPMLCVASCGGGGKSYNHNPLARQLLTARVCVAMLSLVTVGIAIAVYSTDDILDEEEAWYRASPDEKLPFLCQQVHSAALNCPSYWVRSSSVADLCLQRVDIPLDWSTAHKRCGDMGGSLATVHSARQNAELLSFCGASAPCFVGLYQTTSTSGPSSFRWVDGSSLDYTNWHSEKEEDAGSYDDDHGEVVGVKVGSAPATTATSESKEAKVAILMSTVFMALVNMLVMGMACGAFYKAMLRRSPALLLCTTFTDGSCAFCCLFQMVAGIFSLTSSVDDEIGGILEVVIMLVQCVLLVAMTMSSRHISKSFSQVLPLGCSVDDPQLAGFVADAQALNEASRIVTVVGLPVCIQPSPEVVVDGHVAFEV